MDKALTWVEHLSELRKRIIIALAALGAASLLSFPFAANLLKILKLPAAGLIKKLIFFSPQEGFLVYMRIAFFCGWIVSMPVILYQIWLFVSPAMEKGFRRSAVRFILFCFTAFILGGLFAYLFIISPALKFLLSFASEDLEPFISADKYVSFVISLIFGCGLVFQMPVLSLLFTRLGMLTAQLLRKKYKYAIVIIFIAAAIITPTPDAFNMLILAAPMLVLYELSIWVSSFAGRKSGD